MKKSLTSLSAKGIGPVMETSGAAKRRSQQPLLGPAPWMLPGSSSGARGALRVCCAWEAGSCDPALFLKVRNRTAERVLLRGDASRFGR